MAELTRELDIYLSLWKIPGLKALDSTEVVGGEVPTRDILLFLKDNKEPWTVGPDGSRWIDTKIQGKTRRLMFLSKKRNTEISGYDWRGKKFIILLR